jgi:hypothetical protein
MTNTTENQGCLATIFPFLRKKKPESQPESLPYRVRDDFLSPAELSFFRVLAPLLGGEHLLQSKVRLADIFFVARPKENMSFFNRIAQRHVDFLICDASTLRPRLGIELDDASHNRSDRQHRDAFVDSVFAAAELPLLHFPVQHEYNSREVAARIAPILRPDMADPQPAPPPQVVAPGTDSAPLCPKCGIPMVLRTVSQGQYQGRQFYGCPNFPRCREMKPYRPEQSSQG